MTHAEAYRQMYGSAPKMKAVLQQRRAIAQEALATTERLQRRLEEGFPPVDKVGADLNSMLESNLWTLKYRLKAIDKAITECEPEAATRTKSRVRPDQPHSQRTARTR